MQTRSQGNQHLIRYINNIDRLPRELRQQRDRLQADHQDPVDMNNQQDNQVDPPPPQGNPPRMPRHIGAGDVPNTHAQRQGIVPPAIPNNNFEIKSSMINMIQNNKFHGLPMEDPLDHLDEFDRLCGFTKINGVSDDALKLRLFPFSLGDKAKQWEKALPQGSVTSWDDCKKVFLAKYFSNSRTAKLRNEISSFTQKTGETFCEAWERFKSYTSKCPHHGFSNESLLSTLYRGVLPKFRMMLNTASNGNFLNKDVEDGWELVENLAQSDGNYSEEYDRTARSTTDFEDKTRKEMKALNEKLDKLLLVQQKQLNFVCEAEQVQVQDGEGEHTDELCYMQNQAGYNRGFNNYQQPPQQHPPHAQLQQSQLQNKPFLPHIQNPSLAPKPQFQHNYQQQQTNMTNSPGFLPQAPLPDFASMFQQLLQGQAASAQAVAKQFSEVHHNFHDLNTKIEALHSKVTYLESTHTSTSTVKTTGQLPGKAIQNPKEFCNAVFSTGLDAELNDENEHAIEEISRLLYGTSVEESIFDSNVGVQDSIEELAEVEEEATLQVSEDSDSQDGEDFSKSKEKPLCIDQQHRSSDEGRALFATEPEISMEKRSSFIPPPYKPKLPFPGRFKKRLVAEAKAAFDEQMKEIESTMPLTEVVKLIPESHKFLKDLLMERIKETQEEKLAEQQCSTDISKEEATPEKLGDPGSFTLPCSLGPKTFNSCLCDLGSSVSLMPLSVAKRLGFKKYSPTNISLILADRSVKKPHGLLKDLPVEVASVDIPTDFIVLDMDEEPKDPLLLGRPFLATAGAVIDVKNGQIELNLGKGLKMTFDVRNAAKRPTIGGQTFCIEETGQLAAAKDHSKYTCNAILLRDGDAVWEEEESDENEHSEDDFSDSYGIYTSNLARSRARKREQLAAEKLDAEKTTAASSSTTRIDLPVKTLPPAPDEYSELQSLKRKCEWQDKTIGELTSSVKELTCLVKGMKAQIEQLHGQTSVSTSKEMSYGSWFTVDGLKVKKIVVHEVTPEGSPKPLCDPPES